MSEPVTQHSETAYERAIALLRTYEDHCMEDVTAQNEAVDAIPGYRDAVTKALAKARRKHDTNIEAELSAFADRFAEATRKWSGRNPVRERERNAAIAAFALLDESDIRRLLASSSEPGTGQAPEFQVLASMLALSRNSASVVPLMDRLQSVVEYPVLEGDSRFWHFVDKVTGFRLFHSLWEGHRTLDRMRTIQALGLLGDRRAEPAIRLYIDDSDERVRKIARKVLEDLGRAAYAA